ncbi:fused MFS/spermidine synthase [candidate division KSB1 bacterium]|nr:fused MFS/spermidine synthase [candidate division KSB1 bacterium]
MKKTDRLNKPELTNNLTGVSQFKVLLYLAFFLSGTSALVYQVVWTRMLSGVFGVSILSVSAVLSAFMAGLAFGNLYFGKIADRVKNPLNIFIMIELGVGIFALFFPITLKFIQHIFLAVSRFLPAGFFIQSILRFVLVFIFLLIPTTLIGGTFPVVSKFFIRRLNTLGFVVGRLYALYNFGALTGCFLAGFILVQSIGHINTIYAAAGLNLLNALIVFIVNRNIPIFVYAFSPANEIKNPDNSSNPEHSPNIHSRATVKLVLWILALEGFCALAYEVIWTRILLSISYDKSIYFYTTVLFTFIFGLFLGSFLVSRWIDLKKNLLNIFGGLEILIGVFSILILPAFAYVYHYLMRIRPEYIDGWFQNLGKEYLIYFLIMLVPVTLMGMTFPVAGKIVILNIKKIGRKVGLLGFLDTAGSIAGSFVAGFLLVPLVGMIKAGFFIAIINIILGMILLIFNPRLRLYFKIGMVCLVLVLLIPGFMTIPSGQYFQKLVSLNRADRLLFYKEGISGAVTVFQEVDGEKKLYINGSLSAFGEGDLRVDKMRGYLPSLLHPRPQNSLIIGLGMGVASRSLIQPTTESVTCVEINPTVIEACRFFSTVNRDVLQHPLFHVVVDDGRNFLLVNKNNYDVITCNSVHSRLSGVLYTKEFYRLCQNRLTKDGVMCQWISINWMSEREYKSLVRAFMDVFPHTSIWTVDAGFVLLIGTPEPIKIDYRHLIRRLQNEDVKDDLSSIGVVSPFSLLAQYTCRGEDLISYLSDTPANTDNKPLAEFSKVVNKARNPSIVHDLITLKKDKDFILYNIGEDPEQIKTVKNQLDKYVMAEKEFMAANIVKFFDNDPGRMIEHLRNAAGYVPDDPRFHEALSVIYYRTSRYAEALTELEYLIKVQSNRAYDYDHLGRIYFELERYEDAVTVFRKAIELDPQLPIPHFRLASIYRNAGVYDMALKELKTIEKCWPNIPETYFQLGIIYYLKDDLLNSKNSLLKCIQIDPAHKEARLNLNELNKILGQN